MYREGHHSCVAELIKYGALDQGEDSSFNSLKLAVNEGKHDTVRLLIERGALRRQRTGDAFQTIHFEV